MEVYVVRRCILFRDAYRRLVYVFSNWFMLYASICCMLYVGVCGTLVYVVCWCVCVCVCVVFLCIMVYAGVCRGYEDRHVFVTANDLIEILVNRLCINKSKVYEGGIV